MHKICLLICFRFVTDFHFICTMLLLCDVLPTINRLSTMFQTSQLDFSLVKTVVKSTLATIQARHSKDGPALSGLNAYLEMLSAADITVKLPKFTRRAEGSTSREAALDLFNRTIKKPFLTALASNLETRFEDDDIFKAFDALFNPAVILSQSENTPTNRGTESDTAVDLENEATDSEPTGDGLDTAVTGPECDSGESPGSLAAGLLARRFGLEENDVVAEQADFAQFIMADDHEMQKSSVGQIVDKLCKNQSLRGLYPLMGHLAGVFKVIPPHTADCERDFSKLGVIKTRLRNRMTQRTLDGLMRISIEGSELGIAPLNKPVVHWGKQKNRRLKV